MRPKTFIFFAITCISVVASADVEFNLPTPSNKKSKLNKRYHARAKQASSQKRIERRGNFDPDTYEDDEFEAASVKKKTYKKKTHKKTSVKKAVYKKHTTTKKKHTSTKKHTTVKKKKTTTKKHTTTKKKHTTTKTKHTTTKKHTTTVTKGSKTTTSSSATPTKNVVSSSDYAKQANAEWNLIRISQHKRNLAQPYIYNAKAGSDAYVYVIDDGMNIGHVEFEGRASWGWSAYDGASPLGEGHGTHVAGIIGGKTYGVAKKANLIAVQVLNESGKGSISSLLSGLQWVTTHAKDHQGKAVINMSLGMKTAGVTDSALSALNKAIDAVVASGVPLFAAAGNWGTVDACDVLPAGNKNVYTVGATDKNDAMTDFSSYGKCVQILAPGDNILSSYIESKTSTIRMSGTSMASPHAAGVAALLIGQINNATPAKVYNEVTTLATKGVISSISHDTVNRLLFNGQKLSNA
ncbi:hypothetical protein RMATCC62417_15866 [Rhizopus microsporus]|nr:hypothetical protein RMATCC62417_15866 [Rhizopus microsporus]